MNGKIKQAVLLLIAAVIIAAALPHTISAKEKSAETEKEEPRGWVEKDGKTYY